LNGVRHVFTSALFEVTTGPTSTFMLLLTSSVEETFWLRGSITPPPGASLDLATSRYVLEASGVEDLAFKMGSIDLAIAPSMDLELRAEQHSPSTFFFSGASNALEVVLEISAHLIGVTDAP
jgi:hypothetical protein